MLLQNTVVYFKKVRIAGRCVLIVAESSHNDLQMGKFLILKRITEIYLKELVIIFQIDLNQSRKGERLQMPK